MKNYTVKIQKSAQKALDKLDKPVKERILDWLNNMLDGCENPRQYGAALHGNLKGNWRYRVGKNIALLPTFRTIKFSLWLSTWTSATIFISVEV